MIDKPPPFQTELRWDAVFQQWIGPRDTHHLYVATDGYLMMISGSDDPNDTRIEKRFEMADLKMMIREVLDEYELPRRKPDGD